MKVDKLVLLNDEILTNLDFSTCGIPEDVRTMSWENGSGTIHWLPPIENEPITELPQWVLNCIDVFNNAKLNESAGL